MSATPQRILLSGGGTGGHIFPAIALADALRERLPAADIRFVGAKGGMEERLVPQAGYPLETLWIGGLYRQPSLRNLGRNLMLPFKLLSSGLKSRRLLARFRPEVVVGTGGFAAYPILRAAAGGPAITAIAEQNAFPGLANRRLAPRVDLVFLGNPDAERHFQAKNMIFTGNPVRRGIGQPTREAGCEAFGFDPAKPVLLVLGGSLGARAINEGLTAGLNELVDSGFQVLWQCGRLYAGALQEQLAPLPGGVRLLPFIRDMNLAYAAADLAVARAGALTISELIAAGKPAILIPSPNVAGDHQTKNAVSLRDRGAARILPEPEAAARLLPAIRELLGDEAKRHELAANMAAIEHPDAAGRMLDHLLNEYAKRHADG